MEFTYAVPNVWVYFSHGGQADVVHHASLKVTGEKAGRSFTASEGFELDVSDLTSFTPYEELTQTMLVSWIEAQHAARLAEIREHIETSINESIFPTREMRTTTWL